MYLPHNREETLDQVGTAEMPGRMSYCWRGTGGLGRRSGGRDATGRNISSGIKRLWHEVLSLEDGGGGVTEALTLGTQEDQTEGGV